MLELKNRFEIEDIERLIDEIKDLEYLDKIVFISFDFDNCVNVRKMLPESEIQFLTTKEITDELIERLCNNNLYLDIHYQLLLTYAQK